MSDEKPQPADPAPPGWRVLDPDGNVVASGPGIVLEGAAETGDED